MKVALGIPGKQYDLQNFQAWKLDIEKGFLALNPITIIEPKPWTPTLQGTTAAGSPTYTAQAGEWSQIAQRVFFNCFVSISAIGGMTGNVRIAGLPLPSRNVANMYYEHTTRWSALTLSANFTAVVAQQSPGSNLLDLITLGTAGVGVGNLTVGMTGAAANFLVSGSYAI